MAKILFVEDEPDIRDLVRLALEDEHEIISAETAEEGLIQASEHAPDIILMDISLAAGCDEHWTKPITDLLAFREMVARVAAEGRSQ
jgi:CheY-like chemotaxis protein